MGYVSLFFMVNNELLLHKCSLKLAEKSGDFLNYPYSHDTVWIKCYQQHFKKDYDYFPRGRIVYNAKTYSYIIYTDACLQGKLDVLLKDFTDCTVSLAADEHYQCHHCNQNYHDVVAD